MCENCWRDHGAPTKWTPEIARCAELIADVFDDSCVGAEAHIAIDDWNLDDHSIQACLEWGPHGDGSTWPTARAALEALLRLTVEERASALALAEGYFTPPEVE